MTLAQAKQEPIADGLSWYAYDTMASLQHLRPLLDTYFWNFKRAVESGPMLDVGCADGDLGLFFASLGRQVTAVDNPPTNYNWMKGVKTLAQRLKLPIGILERDIDSQFNLPGEGYGLVMLLGILYHLKNPYYVLETLARKSRYCFLSTRIAEKTKMGTRIEEEPLAFLLDHREANNDATNFWIFSPACLIRLAKRTGWRVVGSTIVGCTSGSNPVDSDKDGRMFLFLESQRRSIPANITLLEGWSSVGEFDWAWTLKSFSLQVEVSGEMIPFHFRLGMTVLEQFVTKSPMRVHCTINGVPIDPQTFTKAGDQVIEAAVPRQAQNSRSLRFDFVIDHQFRPEPPDTRELGVIIPFTGAVEGTSEKLEFWLG